jgi:hypothetical protein
MMITRLATVKKLAGLAGTAAVVTGVALGVASGTGEANAIYPQSVHPTETHRTEPVRTEREGTEPERTEPERTEPVRTEREGTEPERTEPERTETSTKPSASPTIVWRTGTRF